jgi:hypothetical protein
LILTGPVSRRNFEIYHRRLQKFVDRDVTIVEIGVFSGGSMLMWRHFVGDGCKVQIVTIT